jgi:predicted kinase
VTVMRRLPGERRLATMVGAADFDESHLTAIAETLAAFHRGAERSPAIDAAGSSEHLAMLWSSNLDEIGSTGPLVDAAQLELVGRRARAYLSGRAPLFARRVTDGRIVDGHGDLLAQYIFCLDDGPRMLDCIEFADRFRWGDVLADTAFLAMDLEHLGRRDLADRFLADYRAASGETHPASLEHWYIAYRALVRCKVACLRAAASDESAPDEAVALLRQAARRLGQAEVRLVLVGGLPGTGKTTVARGIADRQGWELLRSDAIRKELAGVPDDQALDASNYTADARAAVYQELLDRAAASLRMGISVVVDATWLDPRQRQAARDVAERVSARLTECCCVLPAAAAEQRIRSRAATGRDASDATPAVLAAMAGAAAVPWPQANRIDTSGPRGATLERALAVLVDPA